MDFVFGLFIAAFYIWLFAWLFILVPYRMAERRNRDGFVWVAISVIGTPILAIVLLLVAGDRTS